MSTLLARRPWDPIRSLLPAATDFTAMTRNPRRDLLARLTVAIATLPLTLGSGVSSGLDSRNRARDRGDGADAGGRPVAARDPVPG